ncbi:cp12 domai nprotein [Leptolyngbya sp. Heron Island J]|uniref:Calvin cycle protein CP12 n=1 Tax=Leptolyngbya sp. Heron Island J TaxID=1385935 RepID=UPI0003B9C86A|nr:Calvin cycle protein CP12 [Leptolyngbya sp. Heron Island J]ESA35972.1 cp12 domai nprotein [Leptolyngbya sp. Heron Island J]
MNSSQQSWLSLMSYTTVATTTAPSISTPRQTPSSESTFEVQLKAALEHARRLTDMHGPKSIDAAIAWEAVEELQMAKARQPRVTPNMAFARYCAEHPHALESRIYDV